MKLTIIKEFHGETSTGSTPLPTGTVLESTGKIVNNGTPFLAYECMYKGKRIFVKPLIGYVIVGQ